MCKGPEVGGVYALLWRNKGRAVREDWLVSVRAPRSLEKALLLHFYTGSCVNPLLEAKAQS